MMDVYIDLLPENKKEEIKKKKIFRLIIHQEIRLFIPLAIFVAVLLAINFNLGIQLNNLEKFYALEQAQKKYQELKTYENKFRETNSQTLLFSSLQSNHLRWSSVLKKISEAVPEGVYFKKVTTKDYSISIAGTARTRENFLDFEEKIKSADCFLEVNTPLSNLTSKENVDFQIDFKVKRDCLKNQ